MLDNINNMIDNRGAREANWIRRVLLLIFIIILWCIIVIPTYVVYKQDGNKYNNYLGIQHKQDSDDRVDANIYLQSLDLPGKRVNLFSEIRPTGNFKASNATFSKSVSANWFFINQNFKKSENYNHLAFSVPLLYGNIRDYPFDEYSFVLPVGFHNVEGDQLPSIVTFQGSIQSVRIKYSEATEEEINDIGVIDSILGYKVIIQRSATTIAFFYFITFFMWALAFSLAGMCYNFIFHHMEILPPILGLGVSMLFALPSLRNSQPGIPSIGCLGDMLGFSWCLMLIAFSSFINSVLWIVRGRKAHSKKDK